MKTKCEWTGQHETLIVAETGGPHSLVGSSITNNTKHYVNKDPKKYPLWCRARKYK